ITARGDTPARRASSSIRKRWSLLPMMTGSAKPAEAGSRRSVAERKLCAWALEKRMNCLGYMAHDSGHRRVPAPPDSTTECTVSALNGTLYVGLILNHSPCTSECCCAASPAGKNTRQAYPAKCLDTTTCTAWSQLSKLDFPSSGIRLCGWLHRERCTTGQSHGKARRCRTQ